jgi:hypothetical protein
VGTIQKKMIQLPDAGVVKVNIGDSFIVRKAIFIRGRAIGEELIYGL